MSSVDDIKNLLDGTLDPESLEDNPELYEMAESIYGREVLERMGVEAPERPSESIVQPNGDANHEETSKKNYGGLEDDWLQSVLCQPES